MRNIIKFLVLLTFVFQTTLAFGNKLRIMPPTERISNSSLIVIGRVLQVDKKIKQGMWTNKFAVISVTDVLKGESDAEVNVEYEGPIAELNPQCCEVGRSYIFFLRRVDGYIFVPVNGPFGIRELVR